MPLHYGGEKLSLLDIRNLTVKFGGLTAIEDFSMNVKEGEIHSLIGPNGAGKTTVFNVITGVVKPVAGRILFDGTDITKEETHKIVKFGISRTFQSVVVFKYMTVLENLYLGYHSRLNISMLNEIIPNKKSSEQIWNMYRSALEIADFLDLKTRLLSYAGMIPFAAQKMVEIGRALMSKPKLLLLDEPAAGLTEVETEKLKKIIRLIRDKLKITILLVEHDMPIVMSISDKITVLDFGRKISEGAPEQVRKDPKVIKAYLGESESA